MMSVRRKDHVLLAGLFMMVLSAPISGQVGPAGSSAVAVGLALRQADGVKRVLMIGAHPDDEDTGLLAVLARGMGVETAYLSLTRGDGGQNLIGPELGERLGIIRTGELEAARQLDGARQFFTRAYDYGFSKSADEAFRHWPREEVLRDVVSVIRTFRPQVIVSVWSGTSRDGHGQHQASGILSTEAFDVAADPSRFRDLPGPASEPWRAEKLYQSVRFRGGATEVASVSLPTGTFDPLLGRSFFQLAMESRSQHRSQDMGAAQSLGGRASALVQVRSHVLGFSEDDGIFSGIDTTLVGLAEGLPTEAVGPVRQRLEDYRTAIHEAEEALDALRPSQAALPLVRAYRSLEATIRLIRDLGDAAAFLAESLAIRAALVRSALLDAASVVIDVRVDDDLVVAGEAVNLQVQVWNGGHFRIDAASLSSVGGEPAVALPAEFLAVEGQTEVPQDIPPGAVASWHYRVQFRNNLAPSRLYYLRGPRTEDMYQWIGESGSESLPRNRRSLLSAVGEINLYISEIDEPVRIVWGKEAEYVGVDGALGEFREPVLGTPALAVAVEPSQMIWPMGPGGSRSVSVVLRNEAASGSMGKVSLEAPTGWEVRPESISFDLGTEGVGEHFDFEINPVEDMVQGEHVFRAVAALESGSHFREAVDIIEYPHVERTLYMEDADLRVQALPVRVRDGIRVGYVMGSGDDGLAALRQMGVDAEEVSRERVGKADFSGYDVLVLGIRVYETRPDVAAVNDRIIEFARAGGTVIVQYNRQEYSQGDFAPYSISMGERRAARVTDENSPFTLLEPNSPVFTVPNRITELDFEGWVQERGLYFLTEWDDRFAPLLELTDPGEPPTRGSLLVAPVGEGLYMYAALAFFRQFPAGVPGPHRLFANLVSLTGEDWNVYWEGR